MGITTEYVYIYLDKCQNANFLHQIASFGGFVPAQYVCEPAVLAFLAVSMLSICHNVLLNGKYYHEFENSEKSTLTIEDVIPRLKTLKDLPEIAENDVEYHKEHTVIGVNGYWYDVKRFIAYHPGGPVIE